jgi:hypothetical protein
LRIAWEEAPNSKIYIAGFLVYNAQHLEVAQGAAKVFEPSKNDSPLGQKMDDPWPKLPPGDATRDSNPSRQFPTFQLKFA